MKIATAIHTYAANESTLRSSFLLLLLLLFYFFPLSNVWLFLKERGRCVALDTCACDFGWTGASCALPDCSAVDQCSGKGECVSSNQCRCYPGFAGASCSKVADCSIFANCSGHGTCLSMTSGNASCRYGSRVMLLLFIYLFIYCFYFACLFVFLEQNLLVSDAKCAKFRLKKYKRNCRINLQLLNLAYNQDY